MKWLLPIVCVTMMFTSSCTRSDDTPQPASTNKIVPSQPASTSGSGKSGDDIIKKTNKPVHNPVPQQ